MKTNGGRSIAGNGQKVKAVVLAGGKGTRLAPYTTIFPKPLVPIGNKPILEIIIRQLVRNGLREIVLSTGHLGELIEAYFQNGNCHIPGLRISYQREEKTLGTAGPLSTIPGLDRTFLVMNGDVLTNLDYRTLLDFHEAKRATLTIAMHCKRVPTDLGVLKTTNLGRLVAYDEKPVLNFNVSMGIYVYSSKVLDYIPKGRYLDFPDLVNRLLDQGERIVGFPSDAYWLDIGRREDYELAQEEFQSSDPPFQIQ